MISLVVGGTNTVSIIASTSPPKVLVIGLPSRVSPSNIPSSTRFQSANFASPCKLNRPK